MQVHAHRRLDVEADADVAAVTGLGYFQVPTQMGRNEVRSVWYPVRWGERWESAGSWKNVHSKAKKPCLNPNLSWTTALDDNS